MANWQYRTIVTVDRSLSMKVSAIIYVHGTVVLQCW